MNSSASALSPQFMATHWTVVLAAGQEGPGQAAAMAQFANMYWYPIYAYVRRKGHEAEAAQDITQGFFENLLSTDWMAKVERRNTRFSSLLLAILNRYMVDLYRRDSQQKRGGGRELLSIDMAEGEKWYGHEPSTDETPENIFDRRYALSVLHAALENMGKELRASGRKRIFETLSPFLSREPDKGEYEALGQDLGLTRNAVAVTVRRLRVEYRAHIRAEVAGGLLDDAQVDEELHHILMAVTAGGG